MDIRKYNKEAWDRRVAAGDQWTRPVSSETVKAARAGTWNIFLTPTKPVPREWFPEITGSDILCLASGGGQQGPVLSAAGANVTVLDFSPGQLEQDRLVAGQLDAGFILVGFYEDYQVGHPATPYMATHMATRALKHSSIAI